MSDKELIILAAMSIGFRPEGDQSDDGTLFFGKEKWNPLKSDKDALRLAVRVGISISTPDDGDNVASATHWRMNSFFAEKVLFDPYSATRRAIVRAAAELGRISTN